MPPLPREPPRHQGNHSPTRNQDESVPSSHQTEVRYRYGPRWDGGSGSNQESPQREERKCSDFGNANQHHQHGLQVSQSHSDHPTPAHDQACATSSPASPSPTAATPN